MSPVPVRAVLAGAVAAGMATAGLAAGPAHAVDPTERPGLEVRLPGDSSPVALQLTDGALYTAVPGWSGEMYTSYVWRHTLHPTDGGHRVGNPYRVAPARIATYQWGDGIAASDDALTWTLDSPTSPRQQSLHDDRTLDASIESYPAPIASAAGDWFATTSGTLRKVGTEAHVELADVGPQLETRDVQTVEMSGTAVVWLTRYAPWGAQQPAPGYRVHVSAMDDAGLAGTPVVLDQYVGQGLDGVWLPVQLAASDDYVAWTSGEPGAPADAVHWLPTSDLGGAPATLDVDGVAAVTLDGTRLAYLAVGGTGEGEYASRIVVRDLTTGATLVDEGLDGEWATTLDVHGDLLAWAAYDDHGPVARLVSLDGGDLAHLGGFSDVTSGNPFVLEIDEMVVRGLATGYPDGTFRPAAHISREAMAAFLHRLAGSPEVDLPARSPFTDVPTTHPFYSSIVWLAQEEISTGWTTPSGDAQFRPGAAVSREAMAAFLHRMAGSPPPAEQWSFADVPEGHPFAEAIAWVRHTGVSTGWYPPVGQSVFHPDWYITREAMAAFVIRFADLDAVEG